jgi:hypothetical protein
MHWVCDRWLSKKRDIIAREQADHDHGLVLYSRVGAIMWKLFFVSDMNSAHLLLHNNIDDGVFGFRFYSRKC